jgi:hypothetical protein
MSDVEVGDKVVIRKTLHCPFPVNGDVEFKGVVEKIEGDLLTVNCGFNTWATVRKKHIWTLQKKVEVAK